MEKYNIDCLIVGGGIAGLSIARKISSKYKSTFLIEKNHLLGQETSSRNSEVIHAGIYYKPDSLKAKLCVEGKLMLYEYLKEKKIDYMNCGKSIISTSEQETNDLLTIKKNSEDCGVLDLEFNNSKMKDYPFIRFKDSLYSPSSGIFDSHTFINSLRYEFEYNGGEVLLGNEFLAIEPGSNFLEVLINDNNSKGSFLVNTPLVINCAGLGAVNIANSLYNKEKYKNKFVKGEYYNYQGKEELSHLIYPVPTKLSAGLHVTIDLGEGIRFGPSAYEVNEKDYSIKLDKKKEFLKTVQSYWPSIKEEQLSPGFSGIRPTLEGKEDFVIDINEINNSLMVNILGYASPGLTSSLALSKHVESKIDNVFN